MKKTIPRSKIRRYWILWKSIDGLEKRERTYSWPNPVLYRTYFRAFAAFATLTENTIPEGPSTMRRAYRLYDRTATETKRYIDLLFTYRENE